MTSTPSTPFDQHLERVFGKDLPAFLHESQIADYIRINPHKTTPTQVIALLKRYGIEAELTSEDLGALRILSHPFDPSLSLHHFAGHFINQSLSSQIPVHVLNPQPHTTVLDLCASPGSKTTQIASHMRFTGKLYANDVNSKRMAPLAARVDATIAYNTVLLSGSAELLRMHLDDPCDAVLADVPCSGLGDPHNLRENRYRFEKCRNVEAFHDMQYAIAVSGLKFLKVGGRMVYSTCSLNPLENEAIIHALCKRHPVRLLPIEPIDGVVFDDGLTAWDGQTYDASLALSKKVLPWKSATQGFYIALLEKYDEIPKNYKERQYQPLRTKTLPASDSAVQPILKNVESYYGISPEILDPYRFVLTRDKAIHFVHGDWDDTPQRFHRTGICLAKRRGGMWRLSHSAVQLFANHITKNVLHLPADAVRDLAGAGTTPIGLVKLESPYPVLSVEGLGPLATLYAEGDTLRWRKGNPLRLPNDV